MIGKTCFFIGHRESSDSSFPVLSTEVERHITEYGVTDFIVGKYGRFDSLAAQCVKAAKKRRTEVTLTLLLPYHPYDCPIPTPPGFDSTFYPPGMETVPKRVAIVRANRYMVDHSDYLITYAWHPVSNAWNLVEYERGKEEQGTSKLQSYRKMQILIWRMYKKLESAGIDILSINEQIQKGHKDALQERIEGSKGKMEAKPQVKKK